LQLFFFQAEDGIRDYKVTGVQTCALPIFARSSRRPADRVSSDPAMSSLIVTLDPANRGGVRTMQRAVCAAHVKLGLAPHLAFSRSEERRVGKECRCRWWRVHEKHQRIQGA